MMKRLIFILILLIVSKIASAQIAYWTIHPEYDVIEALDNGLYKVRKDGKFGLMGDNDELILPIAYDSIAPFKEDVALLVNKEGIIEGYTDNKGNVASLSSESYLVDNNYPYFSYNHLLVKNMRDNRYYFVRKNAQGSIGPFVSASPFFEGYASVKPFKDVRKGEADDTYALMNYQGERKFYEFNGKIKNDDINFLSSVNNGKVLMAWKKNYYIYDLNTGELEELHILKKNGKPDKVSALGSMIIPLTSSENVRQLPTVSSNAVITLDRYHRVQNIRYKDSDKVTSFNISAEEVKTYRSELSISGDGNMYGISYDNETLLPPQFEQIQLVKFEDAIVRRNGKYGVIHLDKDNDFNFIINNNDVVAFNHKTYDSRVILTMPPYIKSDLTALESKSADLSLLNYDRIDRNNQAEVNSVSYACKLNIPSKITATVADYLYTLTITYDNIKSRDYIVPVKEWFANNYQVTLENMDDEKVYYSEKDSTLTGEIHVTNSLNNENMPISVYVAKNRIETPSNTMKINEGNYKFTLGDVEREDMTLYVIIQEDGCPYCEYQFPVSIGKKGNSRVIAPAPTVPSRPKVIDNPFLR